MLSSCTEQQCKQADRIWAKGEHCNRAGHLKQFTCWSLFFRGCSRRACLATLYSERVGLSQTRRAVRNQSESDFWLHNVCNIHYKQEGSSGCPSFHIVDTPLLLGIKILANYFSGRQFPWEIIPSPCFLTPTWGCLETPQANKRIPVSQGCPGTLLRWFCSTARHLPGKASPGALEGRLLAISTQTNQRGPHPTAPMTPCPIRSGCQDLDGKA